MNTTVLQDLVDIANRERATENIPVLVYTAAVAIFGIVGNLAVISFSGLKKMKSTSTYLMILLTGNDLLVSLIQLASIAFCLNELNFPYIWIFQLYFVTTFALNMGSLLLILIIAIDTYRQVILEKNLSIKAFVIIVTGVYMYPFMTGSRYFFLLGTIPVNKTVNNVSFDVNESGMLTGKYQFWHWFTLGTDFLTFFVVFAGSAGIYWTLFKKQKVMYKTTMHSSPTGRTKVSIEKATTSELRMDKAIPQSDCNILELDTYALDMYKQTTDELLSQNSDNKIEENTTETNTNRNIQQLITKMMCWITVASVVSYFPCITLLITTNIGSVKGPVWQSVIFRSYMVNTSINPYIIGYFNTEFRRFIKRKILCCSPS